MRTYDEMVQSAMSVRRDMLQKGKDPTHGKFFVTETERRVILDKPPFMNPLLSEVRDRICGLQIELISDGPPVKAGAARD